MLALVVVGWGWLLTHSLEGSIDGTDDDVSQWFAGQRSSGLDPVADVGTLLGETPVGLAVGALVAVVAGLVLRSFAAVLLVRWPVPATAASTGSARTPTRAIGRRCASWTPGWSRTTASRRVTSAPPSRCTAAPRSCSRSGCGAAGRGAGAGRIVVVLLACVPLFVAVSRLYQGAHHLTDVATSLVYGTVWLAVLAAVLRPRDARSEPAVPRSEGGLETRQYRTGDREVVLDLTRDCAAYVAERGDGLLHAVRAARDGRHRDHRDRRRQ